MTILTNATLPAPKPLLDRPQSTAAGITMWIFVVLPFVALIAAVPIAWGWGMTIVDLMTAIVVYLVAGFGVTAGYHRYLTHGSFKSRRWLRVTLAVAGSLAVHVS